MARVVALQGDPDPMILREIPILGAALAISGDILVSGGDILLPILEGLILSLGDILPIISIMSGIIAPEIDWMPEGLFTEVLLVVALLVVGVQTARLISKRL